ncbi:MAG: GspH/FimT family pseudopilin [Pseudomonadales bacterium]
MRATAHGLTLIELLATLLVLATLLHLATPAFTSLYRREQSTAALNGLIGAVNLARASAITLNRSVVLCPSDARDKTAGCAARNQWHLGALVFADSNHNGQHNSSEPILRRVPGWQDGATVSWRSFRNRSYLRFKGSGLTDWQNGSFTWCPEERTLTEAVQVVVNAAGRTRIARDSDHDGIAEDSNGKPLRC